MGWLQTEESPRAQTLCPQNITWMKKHLEQCDTLHYAGLASSSMPTRLLDLGDDDLSNDFRLIDTVHGQAERTLQYAALSYCWGSEKHAKMQVKTLTSNLKQHCNLIKFSTATPVVQDAVTIARALSIRYLWVDALCIVQDDGIDWANESGKMGDIYANAYITFCTLTSTSCMEGFLTRPSTVNISFNSKKRPSVQGVFSLRHQHSWDRFATTVGMQEHDFDVAGTWSKRAWTLQEQHLSKRRLYFGCSRVYLHCAEDKITEPRDSGNEKENEYYDFYDSFHDHVQRFRKDGDVPLLYQHWTIVTCNYSNRHATYTKDMLPALSGLARIMGVELDDTYLAGLWKNDLPHGLLWRRMKKGDDWDHFRKRLVPGTQKPYIAPSWSWASRPYGEGYNSYAFTTDASPTDYIKGNFGESMIETGFRSECVIAGAWCTPVFADVNKYGQIKDGEIHVAGKLKKCSSSWVPDPRASDLWDLWVVAGDDTSPAACDIDFHVSKETKELHLNNVHMLLLSSSCGFNWHWPDREDYENALSLLDDSDPDPIKQTYLAMSKKFPTTWIDNQEGDEEDARPEEDSHDSWIWRKKRSDTDFTPRERAKQRNAWGLLVYPVADTGKFIRIGVFRVSFERGGLRAFDDVPVSLVKLI